GGELPGGSGAPVRAECYGAALLDSLKAVSEGFRPRPGDSGDHGRAEGLPVGPEPPRAVDLPPEDWIRVVGEEAEVRGEGHFPFKPARIFAGGSPEVLESIIVYEK